VRRQSIGQTLRLWIGTAEGSKHGALCVLVIEIGNRKEIYR